MNWYLSKMVYRIVCGDGNHTAQFDEQLRLIEAESKEEAFHKTNLLGLKGEDNFFNQKLELVQWQFIGVADLIKLNKLADGVELYSRIEEKDYGENYVQFIYAKTGLIRFNDTAEFLNVT